MDSLSNVIAISYAKRVFDNGSRERVRMREYASVLGCYHIIVFTKKAEGVPSVQKDGKLTLHATNSYTKIGMVFSAILIGRKIVKNNRDKKFVVSTQDPFETSFIGRCIASAGAVHQVQIHGDVFNPLYFHKGAVNSLRIWFGKKVVRSAGKIRVVSKRIKDSLLEFGVTAEKITILPIQPELKKFLEVGKNRVYQNVAPLKLLYVGRFSKEKNLPLLLKAFARVQKNFSCKLILLGEGPEETHLVELADSLGIKDTVQFLPWTDAVELVMAEVDVLCLSSNHEGYAMVLLEAMAAGLPIITTDVGCAGEILINNQHGLVVPVGEVKAYENAMYKILSQLQLRISCGKNAFSTAQKLQLTQEEYLSHIQNSFSI